MKNKAATQPHPLELIFRPRSVAVVGASTNPESQGWMYLKELLEFPFKGPVYPVAKGESRI
ncbi:MAG: CoA-binding protein, partial [Deltaproteobacteria bacterium]|nr:CoA-binding protein [Deltaproteobacteria bacterium]